MTIFNDPLIVTIPDRTYSKQEQRYVSLGVSVKVHILVVIHVERSNKTRLISCRKATPRERRIYEKLNK
ncbi:MAG: BrnT family toxin [Chloroflexi bacterium]|nr:BrnT family toxin [Chloroflexota bacterium]